MRSLSMLAPVAHTSWISRRGSRTPARSRYTPPVGSRSRDCDATITVAATGTSGARFSCRDSSETTARRSRTRPPDAAGGARWQGDRRNRHRRVSPRNALRTLRDSRWLFDARNCACDDRGDGTSGFRRPAQRAVPSVRARGTPGRSRGSQRCLGENLRVAPDIAQHRWRERIGRAVRRHRALVLSDGPGHRHAATSPIFSELLDPRWPRDYCYDQLSA